MRLYFGNKSSIQGCMITKNLLLVLKEITQQNVTNSILTKGLLVNLFFLFRRSDFLFGLRILNTQ
jgi:hypothetical protein